MVWATAKLWWTVHHALRRSAMRVLGGERGATTAEYALACSDNLRTLVHFRRLDDLGRVVLPAESRRRLRLADGAAVEIIDVPDGILIRPVRGGRAQP